MKWQDFFVLPVFAISFYIGYNAKLIDTSREEKVVQVHNILEPPNEVFIEPETVLEPEVLIDDSYNIQDPFASWLDPSTIPQTRPWNYNGSDLRQHMINEHEVTSDQIFGWSEQDLRKLHSYIHNGGVL